MISFTLICVEGHEFEGWFGSNSDFEKQNDAKLVACPICNSTSVTKALMAPAVSTAKQRDKATLAVQEKQREAMAIAQKIAQEVKANSENVGNRFAEEARKIHYGETEKRGIYGEATTTQVESLVDEGVPVMALPVVPDDQN